jgi:hypothetical protein
MAAPNILSATTCIAKSALQETTVTLTSILSNSAGSGQVLKVNSILATNKTITSSDVTVDILRSSISYPIAYGITVPTKSSLIVLGKDTPLYIEEGDILRISSSIASALNITVVYEVVS